MASTVAQNKTALITGAARGIGSGIAIELSGISYNIAISDILDKALAQNTISACEKNGVKVIYIQSDISNEKSRCNIVKEVMDTFNRIDILVNNAGVAPLERKDILEGSEESFDRLININLKGPYFLTQKIANWMIELKKKDAKLFLKIINISSMSSYTSSPSRGEYCISKAGVSMMTKLFADRLSEYGINVYEIRPGIIQTEMTSTVQDKYNKLINEGILLVKRWGYPKDIALAVSSIAQDHFPYSTGEVFNIDGGFHLRRI